MVWAFQPTPHDMWDYDAVNENILVDLPIGGTTRKALVHFDRNGFAYTMDRATGEVLLAKPFVPMNWSTGVDMTTGRPMRESGEGDEAGQAREGHLPVARGRQEPAARGVLAADRAVLRADEQPLHGLRGARSHVHRRARRTSAAMAPEKGGPGGYNGEFMAWDATTGRKVWGIKEPYPVWGGALATAGGVVFYGTLDGWFKAVDARNGDGALEVQGRLGRRRQSRSRIPAPTASSTSRSIRASAATWAC